jgi:hypothetical protein
MKATLERSTKATAQFNKRRINEEKRKEIY